MIASLQLLCHNRLKSLNSFSVSLLARGPRLMRQKRTARGPIMRGSRQAIGAAFLSLLISAAGGDPKFVIETSHALIEARAAESLKVLFFAEEQPALLFKPASG